MEHHTRCSVKGTDSQLRVIPQHTTSEGCKRLEDQLDTDEKFEFVGCRRMLAGDDKPLYGPFRLKDGLFFSLRSVSVNKTFLKTNKISHIVAIDDSPQQPFEEPQANLPSEESKSKLIVPYRSLRLHWQGKERPGDPAVVKQKLKDLATAVAFIDEALEQGGSCLLHSSNDVTTAAAAATAYLVIK
ncbi:hypothetical protein, conserved [Eimeria praecox]|uniref:Uncharacterized protein n=1 Tax=Eimeria praecox TaxID=51316 RepID=U6H5E8_9EIME|nr:hypothetical protein, conserved [Eimeria praecox]